MSFFKKISKMINDKLDEANERNRLYQEAYKEQEEKELKKKAIRDAKEKYKPREERKDEAFI